MKTDAREIIARQIPGTSAEVCFGVAEGIIDALNAAGIRLAGPDDRILGPDEVDQVTLERAADRARECFDDPQAEADQDYVPSAIRALGRKV